MGTCSELTMTPELKTIHGFLLLKEYVEQELKKHPVKGGVKYDEENLEVVITFNHEDIMASIVDLWTKFTKRIYAADYVIDSYLWMEVDCK